MWGEAGIAGVTFLKDNAYGLLHQVRPSPVVIQVVLFDELVLRLLLSRCVLSKQLP